jgi:hypothetical protein
MPGREPIIKKADPEKDSWLNWKLGFTVLLATAGTIAAAERLRRHERSDYGSYKKALFQAVRQMEKVQQDPSTLLIELPANRTLTRFIAAAAPIVGVPLHHESDPLPRFRTPEDQPQQATVPSFVDDIRAYRIRGSQQFIYEEIDVRVTEGTHTISALVGRSNALILFNSYDTDRSLRILSCYELGRQGMQERNLRYEPPTSLSI